MDPTELSAGQLAQLIQQRTLSVSEIISAHVERIKGVNGRLNAVIWPMYEQAMEQATQADQALDRGQQAGALFGIPITIKDQYLVSGTPTSCGLGHRSQQIIHREGALVQRLRQQGAIILGKTNVPQLMVSHECQHGLYGHCKNPFDLSRVPGGSSGGEASIIAAGGSPWGLGGDMGGSIRIPAHCCGISGLKPTATRLPNDDSPLDLTAFAEFAGFEGYVTQPGPMARVVDDLKLMMDCLLQPPPPSVDVVPAVPWKTGPIVDNCKLRIGVYTDSGFFEPSTAIKRVVGEAASALADRGLAVEPFVVPDGAYAVELAYRLVCSGGGHWLKTALRGEKPTGTIKTLIKSSTVPNFLRGPMASLLNAFGQKLAANLITFARPTSAREYWELCAKRTEYRARFLQAMEQQQLDILVCPAYGLPAPQLDSNGSGVVSLADAFTIVFNLLGMPAGTVAAGTVQKSEEETRQPSADAAYKAAEQIDRGSAGLPLGVQVVGKHWREDQVLSVMKLLEQHFVETEGYPRTPVRM